MDVLKSVIEHLDPQPKRIFVGVSGGLDSVVLLDKIAKTYPADKITVLHVNHHIQEKAEEWTQFVEVLAQGYVIACEIGHLDPQTYVGENIEGQARAGRYTFFEKHLTQEDDYLFLAHHQQDQIETFFLNLQRGAGLAGLSAMPECRAFGHGFLVRPLLTESRQSLEAYAKAEGLTWVEDPSNQDTRLNRNFLRSEVLPLLRKRWPHFDDQVERSIQHLQVAREIVEECLERELAELLVGEAFDLKALMQLPPNRHLLLIQRWVKSKTGKVLAEKQLQIIIDEVIGASADAQPLFEMSGLKITRKKHKLILA